MMYSYDDSEDLYNNGNVWGFTDDAGGDAIIARDHPAYEYAPLEIL